jgi:hypothetical protein
LKKDSPFSFEREKRIKIALERGSIVFLNEWNLINIYDMKLTSRVLEKVDFFKILSINFALWDEIPDILFKKYIENLTVVCSQFFYFNTRFLREIHKFYALRSLTLRHIRLDKNVSFSSTTLEEINFLECDDETNFPEFHLDLLPRLKRLKIDDKTRNNINTLNFYLPEKTHPLEELLIPNFAINFINNKPYSYFLDSIPSLKKLHIKYHGVAPNRYPTEDDISKFGQINFLIDIVLNNEGEIYLKVPPLWNYFKPTDKLKQLIIMAPNENRNVKHIPIFPECEEIMIPFYPQYSLEKLPKSVKRIAIIPSVWVYKEENKLLLNSVIGDLASLPNLTELSLSTYEQLGPIFFGIKFLKLSSFTFMGRPESKRRLVFLNFDGDDVPCPSSLDFPKDEILLSISGKLNHPLKITGEIAAIAMHMEHKEHNMQLIEGNFGKKLLSYNTRKGRADIDLFWRNNTPVITLNDFMKKTEIGCIAEFYESELGFNYLQEGAPGDEGYWPSYFDSTFVVRNQDWSIEKKRSEQITIENCHIYGFQSFGGNKSVRFLRCKFFVDDIDEFISEMKKCLMIKSISIQDRSYTEKKINIHQKHRIKLDNLVSIDVNFV